MGVILTGSMRRTRSRRREGGKKKGGKEGGRAGAYLGRVIVPAGGEGADGHETSEAQGGDCCFGPSRHTDIGHAVLEEEEGIADGVGARGAGRDGAVVGALQACGREGGREGGRERGEMGGRNYCVCW